MLCKVSERILLSIPAHSLPIKSALDVAKEWMDRVGKEKKAKCKVYQSVSLDQSRPGSASGMDRWMERWFVASWTTTSTASLWFHDPFKCFLTLAVCCSPSDPPQESTMIMIVMDHVDGPLKPNEGRQEVVTESWLMSEIRESLLLFCFSDFIKIVISKSKKRVIVLMREYNECR